MPSNKEIIAKAVDQVISSNDSIDLLLISQTLDDINGEVVGSSTDYGMHYNMLYIGMTGQKFVDQMNSNWEATDAQFLDNQNELAIRIVSNQIKEIKLENSVLYYTTDEDTVEDRTWIPVEAGWGKIIGTITDQTDLQEALAQKAELSDFNTLSATVSTNGDNIILLRGDVDTLSDTVSAITEQISGTSGILVRLDSIEALLVKKITSDTVLEIRTVNDTALEFTTDGENWHPVSSAGLVEWGDVIGDIANQADLQLLFDNLTDLINNHINDVDNPHQVTKAQLDLGNVNNTADVDKPVSDLQQIAIDTAKTEAISTAKEYSDTNLATAQEYTDTAKNELLQYSDTNLATAIEYSDTNLATAKEYTDTAIDNINFKSLTQADYEALETKNSNTFYFINDL